MDDMMNSEFPTPSGDTEEEEEQELDLSSIPQVSKSPRMNELHAMAKLMIEGKVSPERFKNRLDAEVMRFYGIYKNFLQIYQKAELPEDLDMQARKVFQSLEKYDKALQELNHFFESMDAQEIDAGLQNALMAIDELTTSYEVFVNKQSPSLTKKCPECGHPNPIGRVKCKSCYTLFTLSNEEIPLEFYSFKWKGKESSFSLGAAPFPGSIIEAYDNYDKLIKGVITREKYLEDIDWIITQIELSRRKLEREQYTAPPDVLENAGPLFDGMDHAKVALEKLRDKVLWDRHDNLNPEWNKLLLAINLILEAQPVLQYLTSK